MSEQQGGTAWLRRNAREIDYEAARDSNPWDRAKEAAISAASQAVTAREDGEPVEGRWRVALSNSDRVHDVLLLKAPNGDYAGACDCEGYVKGGHTCAHLCFVRMRESVGDLEVPESSNKLASVMEESASEEHVGAEKEMLCQDCDGDTVHYLYHSGDWTCSECGKVLGEASEETVEAAVEAVEVPEGDGIGMPIESAQNGSTPARPDAFAEPLPDVPEEYVMELGGEKYIRRAGYARLGRQAGLSHSLERIDGGRDYYVMKATVTDGERTWEDYGTAHAEGESMDGAEYNLYELAATRALTRAYAWATGEGLTAVAEVHPGGER